MTTFEIGVGLSLLTYSVVVTIAIAALFSTLPSPFGVKDKKDKDVSQIRRDHGKK